MSGIYSKYYYRGIEIACSIRGISFRISVGPDTYNVSQDYDLYNIFGDDNELLWTAKESELPSGTTVEQRVAMFIIRKQLGIDEIERGEL